jgi:anti-anti-sigma factor
MFHQDAEFSSHFRVKNRDGVLILDVHGPEIRQPEPALELGADIRKLVDQEKPRGILVDLGRVRYMCSTGFGALLEAFRTADAAGCRLKVCGLHPDVAVGANILGLGRVIETFADERSALQNFT